MTQARTKMTVVAAVATFLATLTLWPLLEVQRWPYTAVLVIVLMAAVGWLTRRLRVPGVLTPFAYALVLLLALTGMFAQEDALFSLLPTPASLEALRELLVDALIDVRRYATPAPETSGLLLLVAGGVGLIAALVDLIAVRGRHPGAAGLPMLALYSVSAGILEDGPGWVPFTLGAVGYLAMLLTDNRERLERWGRPVLVRRSWDRRPTTVTKQIADTTPLASLGRRLGVAAIAVALVAPLFVPLSEQAFGSGGVGSSWLSRFGAPTLQAPDPVVSMRRTLLRQSNEVMFTYRSDAARPEYLRTVALTEFDGEAWRPGRLRGYDEFAVTAEAALPVPPGSDLTSTRTVKTTVAVRDEVSLKFLPLPYAPNEVDAGPGWYYDPTTLTVFAPNGSARGVRYQATSEVPRPSPEQLEDASAPSGDSAIRNNLQLPDDLPRAVRERARSVTEGKKDRYAKALALQEWFTDTGGFRYSTEPGGNGEDALLEFLQDRRGYCEQYSSAMAVMARSLGIPARVAVGFTQGVERGGLWVVRGKDAHAWPELWFEGVGWVRFEPTPSGAGGQGTADVPGYTEPDALERANNPNQNQPDDPSATEGSTQGPSAGPERPEPSVGQAAGGGQDTSSGLRGWLGVAGAALAVVLLLLVPALVRAVASRRRWRKARDPVAVAHVAWTELRDDAANLGFTFRRSETPRTAAARLVDRAELPAATRDAVHRVAMAEELARYAPRADTPAGLRADVRAVHRALARRVSLRTRLRSFLFPRSTLGGLGRPVRTGPPDDQPPGGSLPRSREPALRR